MAVQQDTTHSFRNTHAEVRIMKCPNCGNELHFSRRTVYVTCRCGKTFRLESQTDES